MTNKWGPHMTEHLDPLRIANEKIEELMRMVAYERGERERLAAEVKSHAPKLSDLNDDLLALEDALRARDEAGEQMASLLRRIAKGTYREVVGPSAKYAVSLWESAKANWPPPAPTPYTFAAIPTPPEVQDMVRDAINGEGEFA